MSSLPTATRDSRSPSRTKPWWISWCCGLTFTVTRFNVVALQLTASLVTISFWAAHQVTEKAWTANPPHGHQTQATFKLFAIYVGLMPLWQLCVFLDIYREGTIVSRVLFELVLVSALAAYNGHLIPPILADGSTYRDGTFSVVYFAVQIAALIINVMTCSCWVLALLGISLDNHIRRKHAEVWISGVRDFGWYGYGPPAGIVEPEARVRRPSLLVRLFVGQTRGLGIKHGFYRPLNQFLSNHTVFRRVVGVEPLWLSLIRGSVGLAFLVGLLAYAVIQCIKLPLAEDGSTLPVRPREIDLWAREQTVTPLENVTVAFTIYPISGSWVPNTLPVQPNTQVFYADGTNRTCDATYVNNTVPTPSMWTWNCSRPGGIPDAFGTNEYIDGSHTYLQTLQTYITVTLDWGVFIENNLNIPNMVALAGMDTVVESPFDPKTYPSVLQFQHPSYVEIKMGKHLKAQVEEYSILRRRLEFVDVVGIAGNPQMRIYHPLTSVQPLDSTIGLSPTLSSVTFYPSYGLVGQHLLEEYREYTVLAGLGSTGGLYAILDLIFGILFGRPLVAIIFGSKYISPFGLFVALFGGPAMRRKLKKRYPSLGSDDSIQRSFSTSDFLHDFVLDFGPGIAKPNMFAPPPPSPPPGERSRYSRLETVDGHQDQREGDKFPMEMAMLVHPDSPTQPISPRTQFRIQGEEYQHARDFDPTDLERGGR